MKNEFAQDTWIASGSQCIFTASSFMEEISTEILNGDIVINFVVGKSIKSVTYNLEVVSDSVVQLGLPTMSLPKA